MYNTFVILLSIRLRVFGASHWSKKSILIEILLKLFSPCNPNLWFDFYTDMTYEETLKNILTLCRLFLIFMAFLNILGTNVGNSYSSIIQDCSTKLYREKSRKKRKTLRNINQTMMSNRIDIFQLPFNHAHQIQQNIVWMQNKYVYNCAIQHLYWFEVIMRLLLPNFR